jgi:hypothetical protein
MIPYDELVAALTSWRERQGLPVRREDLFDVDASLAPLGVGDALTTPLLPDTGQGIDVDFGERPGTDPGDTRLATSDVVALDDDAPPLAGIGADEDEATFIGSSPGWSGGDAPPASPAGGDWQAGLGDDATGESPMAPPRDDDPLGDQLDAALAEGDPTPDVPPPNPVTADDLGRDDALLPASTVIETAIPEASSAAPAEADAPWPRADSADPVSPWDDAGASPAAGASTDEPLGHRDEEVEAALDGALGAEDPAERSARSGDIAIDDDAIVGEDDAIVGEHEADGPFHEAATAIRDSGGDSDADFEPPLPDSLSSGGAELAVDADDVLDSRDDPDDEGPFRP